MNNCKNYSHPIQTWSRSDQSFCLLFLQKLHWLFLMPTKTNLFQSFINGFHKGIVTFLASLLALNHVQRQSSQCPQVSGLKCHRKTYCTQLAPKPSLAEHLINSLHRITFRSIIPLVYVNIHVFIDLSHSNFIINYYAVPWRKIQGRTINYHFSL